MIAQGQTHLLRVTAGSRKQPAPGHRSGHTGGAPRPYHYNTGERAFANANWTGGGLGTNGYGETNPNYTVEPSYTPEGCTHSGFNDCASSIDNEGPYNGYYWWNAGCTGERYNNTAYTGTNFLGTYWNDEFSSDRVGYSEHC